jgi:hypothetical protein
LKNSLTRKWPKNFALGKYLKIKKIVCRAIHKSENYVVVGDKVRRGKALDFSGCNSCPGTGSLHSVANEAAAEATKRSAFLYCV